ncbi:single-stranded-DNA-specific exonuclease RecJ [Pinisolibacter aquiterrae]|uniref:single-stranded-DNA-specific exonuclease RecJ n=1 Tax=Pinisolibacter aquiterrae TaxID=2815579 RepID=UPI001C3D682C|nr:single-stranded-DNA-specific exonuclease RecJ [Pinisolibacter aquiterrae]MBV5265968.1 single-stranded-DNA-specific exonuclease RecJ [Pinisolibacter aquiterrae]MCC8237175.1 single-stranded-DNA-specific exonuclease RecJ [Pinisolibacter aquiterrae]
MRPTGFAEETEDRAVLGVTSSASGRVWRDRLDAAGATRALGLAQRLDLPDIVARVLAARGVDADEAAGFLDPTIKALMPDPSVVTAMDVGVARLADAVVNREPIALFADYDVDGATSAALMRRHLVRLGADPIVYIPDRLIEGYGPNPEAIEGLRARGASLLVTLDCGSTSHEALAHARRLGLDTVVIDHHGCGLELPPAVAVINPNRHDDLSGLGHLCACGVAFVTLVALNRELRRRGFFLGGKEPDLLAMLDLVALGTVADVVPLTGLNRAFVVKGLQVARRRGNAGLAALAAVARVSGPMSPYHLGFLIGPRINAGGRIGDAGLGSRLLATDDPVEAEKIAAELDRLNKERQVMEAAMVEEADAQVVARFGTDPGPIVVTASPDWHPGVVGLIASRLKERWHRSALAVAFDRGPLGTGSGRSVPGVDLGAAVRAAVEAGLIPKGGGHAMAAGLTVAEDRLDAVRDFLAERLAEGVGAATARRELAIDGAMTATGATVSLVETLERAGPYGSGQPEPLFAFPAHRVAFADEVGQGHVRLSLASGDGTTLKAIAFRAASEPIGRTILEARGRSLHVVGALGLDHWQGDARVQLRVVDVAEPRIGGL